MIEKFDHFPEPIRLDSDIFPEIVTVYRIDKPERVENGMRCARSMIASTLGESWDLDFIPQDV